MRIIIVILALIIGAGATAKPPKAQKAGAASKAAPGAPAGERTRDLDFEGEVIEGMNKRPLDSLTSLSEGEGDRSKGHLYRRTKKFKQENQELTREILETY